jgi:hypothetical protein
MDTALELCLGVVIAGCVLGILIGYVIVGAGISDALGPFFALICMFTIFPMFIMGPLGIGNNPKITLGMTFIVVSIVVLLAIGGLLGLLS